MTDQSPNLGLDDPTDFKPSDSDVEGLIRQRGLFQNSQINQGMDADADTAAHSMRLSDQTGVPATVIAPNYDTFVEQQKKLAAQNIVQGNPDLQDYIMSHPLATSVSNDDWAVLDKFTRENSGGVLQTLHGKLNAPFAEFGNKLLQGIVQGAGEGAQQGLGDDDYTQRMLDPQQNVYGAAGAGATRVLDLLMRGFNAAGGAAGGALAGAGQGLGLEEAESRRASEAIMNEGMAESGMHEHAPEAAHAPAPQSPLDAAKPWIAGGEEPPAGLHPQIDAAKAEINATYLEQLDKDVANAAASTTRERSPELFGKLTERMYGEARIGVAGQAVLDMYGEKTPEAEDGLLGWVPGIEDQLKAARDVGSDISIPIKDWVARIDPGVSDQLADHIRMWEGGVTADEAKGQVAPKQVIDDAVPNVRAVTASEPVFGQGDRKLTLLPEAEAESAQSHSILDENGQEVGKMQIVPEADGTLRVERLEGAAGVWSDTYGPALMQDLKRQLAEAYPEHDTLVGPDGTRAKLTGAHDEAEQEKMQGILQTAHEIGHVRPMDDLNMPGGWENLRDKNGLVAGLDDGAPLPEWHDDIKAIVDDLTKKFGLSITPNFLVGKADNPGLGGMASSHGHLILSDKLDRQSAIATGLHEFGHIMEFDKFSDAPADVRDAITKAWKQDAARGQDTIAQTRPITSARYNEQVQRAPSTSGYHRNFQEWFAEQVSRWLTTDRRPLNVVEKFFSGISSLWKQIYERVTGHVGLSDAMREFVEGQWRGDEGGKGLVPGEPAAPSPKKPMVPLQWTVGEPIIEGIDNVQAAAVGLPSATWAKMKDLIQKRAKADLDRSFKQAAAEQAKRQGAEWKANWSKMAGEVGPEIRQRPDVAVDSLLADKASKVKLDPAKLTPEQKGILPKEYLAKDGVDPDQLASLHGYSSGEEMVAAVGALQAQKLDAAGKPMRQGDFIRKLIKAETDQRMEAEHGNLGQNILEAAQDQALSASSVNLMYEEYLAVAERAGVTAFDKSVAQTAARNAVDATQIGGLSSFRLMQDMGKHGRNGQIASVAGNWAEATQHLQRQTMTMMMAKEAKAVEKEIAKFDKAAKRLGKFDQPSLPPEFANAIQQVLSQVGKKVDVTPEYLTREMQKSGWGTDLRSFVDEKTKYGAIIDPWEDLYDARTKFEYKAMTVEQFRNADAFVSTMAKAGRDERKVYKQGEAFDFQNEIKPKLIEGIQRLKSIKDSTKTSMLRSVGSMLLQHENFVDLWDRWDTKGPWNSFFYRGLKEGDNTETARTKEVVKNIQSIIDTDLPKGDLPNGLFLNPRTGKPLVTDRESLWTAMLNHGNKDNMEHFAAGWSVPALDHKVTADAVRQWIDQHATKEDWDGVQKIWDLLQKTGGWSDDTYRSMAGRAMRRIEPDAVKTQFGDYAGGYYPKMFHPDFPGKSASLLGLSKDKLFGSGYSTGFAPGAGYRIERTDYSAPLALDMKQLPARIIQQIHDAALRPAVMQAAKILRDPDIRDAMIEHSGKEVYDSFNKWLRRVANDKSPSADMSMAMQNMMGVGDYLRRNIITNMVGLNLGTVEKHGPTAFINSIAQVGLGPMLKSYTQMFGTDDETGMNTMRLAHEKSLELQRRMRGVEENMYGSVDDLHNKGSLLNRFSTLRDYMQHIASFPVAVSDMLSAAPMWWAEYQRGLKDGDDEGTAVYSADKLVRKAHGSTSITSNPMVMNEVSRWFTPMYNFYNDVMNRAVESYWRAGEAQRAFKEGDYDRFKKQMKSAAVLGFTSLIMPAVIHNLVDPPKTDPNDSTLSKMAAYVVHPYTAFFPFIRDFVPFIMGNDSPDVGLYSAAYKEAGQLPKDLLSNKGNGPAHTQKLLKDGGTWMGFLTGAPGTALGRWASGAYGYARGTERPQGLIGLHDMVRFGTTKGHARNLQDVLQGNYDRRK